MNCNKVAVNSILSEVNMNFDFYKEYILNTQCTCEKCIYINRFKDNIVLPKQKNNNHYSSYLLNIRTELLKNDLYAQNIFSNI